MKLDDLIGAVFPFAIIALYCLSLYDTYQDGDIMFFFFTIFFFPIGIIHGIGVLFGLG